MITEQDIIELCASANLAAPDINSNPTDLTLVQWSAGIQTHIPLALPLNTAAVYIFKWNNHYLKVGKVNPNSNARYQYHHYNPDSSGSNLSKSLLNEPEFQALLGDGNVGEWLKTNTSRFNILIPENLDKKFVHFAEAFFILK
jgi:hypothetical protein